MGEIAEMMLDGTLCAGCGRALMGHGNGDPRYCKACRKEETAARHEAHQAAAKRAKCPQCSRKVKLTGLQDHIRDAHGDAKPTAGPDLGAMTLAFTYTVERYMRADDDRVPPSEAEVAEAMYALRAAIAKATGSAA